MRRRQFLAGTTTLVLLSKLGLADEIPTDLRVTPVVGFDVRSRRPKLVGKNSRIGVHGDSATDRMLRLDTNMGVQGIGNCRAGKDSVAKLLGQNPFDFYRAEHDPLTNDVLIADGYTIKNGSATVADAPGFGISINEDKFTAQAQINFDLKA